MFLPASWGGGRCVDDGGTEPGLDEIADFGERGADACLALAA